MMPLATAIERRDLRLDEANAAADFFHRCWRPNHVFYRNRNLLLWQFHQNPYAREFTGGLTFRAAFAGSELVGAFGYIPFVFNLHGERRYGCHLSNWWVDPNHRRGSLAMGLLHDLQFRHSVDLCVAGIVTPVAEVLYERLGWSLQRNVLRLILPLDRERFEGMLEPEAISAWHEAEAAQRAQQPASAGRAANGMEVHPLQDLNQLSGLGWDSFFWSNIAPALCSPAREEAWLVWRYQQMPVFRYRGLVATRGQEARGVLVYRIEQIEPLGGKVMRIVELTAEREAAAALIAAAVDEARREGTLMADFFCTSAVHFDVLQAQGFLNASFRDCAAYWAPFLFQPLDQSRRHLNCAWWMRPSESGPLKARDQLVLMKGDHEFDRPN